MKKLHFLEFAINLLSENLMETVEQILKSDIDIQ